MTDQAAKDFEAVTVDNVLAGYVRRSESVEAWGAYSKNQKLLAWYRFPEYARMEVKTRHRALLKARATRSRNKQPRDAQRAKLYKAEWAALGSMQLRSGRTIAEVNTWLTSLLEIYRERYEKVPTFVQVESSSGNHAIWSRNVIRLTLRGREQDWVCLHELAHLLVKENPGHGRKFASVYLTLVTEVCGRIWGDRLREAFREHGVKYQAKRELSPARLAALRERGKQLAASRWGSPSAPI